MKLNIDGFCSDIYENTSKSSESLQSETRRDPVDPIWADLRLRIPNVMAPLGPSGADEPRTLGFHLTSDAFGENAGCGAASDSFSLLDPDALDRSGASDHDAIVCIETFQHLSAEAAEKAIRAICAATPRVLVIASPNPSDAPSPIDLLRAFAQCGFAPVAALDASNIRPWAFALERSDNAIGDDLLVLHAELIATRTRFWRESRTLNLELSETRRAFNETVESLATRHVEALPANASLGLMQRFSRFQRRLRYVRQSIFFDPDWYSQKYCDVPEGADPAEHYLTIGRELGRDPGPAFSASGYLAANPDVAETGYDPLVHYERYGKFEGRQAVFPQPGMGPLVLKRIVRIDEKKPGEPAAAPAGEDDYQDWIARFDRLSDEDRDAIRRHIESLPRRPLISVVMPVYETPAPLLREALDSVCAQLYPHWELCIADDASPSSHVAEILADYAARDSRIRFVTRETNGHISAATNSALALATGEFVALMDHDDVLSERALYEIAVELDTHPDADILYSDEDRIDETGRRHNPHFKTDWNPELFLGQNMISHLGVYRRSLIEAIGGFRIGLEGSQDYDLALRARPPMTASAIFRPFSITGAPPPKRSLFRRRTASAARMRRGAPKPIIFAPWARMRSWNSTPLSPCWTASAAGSPTRRRWFR